jgi:hypothetical protein
MCEPAHSIVQYPVDFDDSDLPGQHISPEQRLSKLGKFIKRVGRFFHLSKLGAGHTFTMSQVPAKIYEYLPPPISYEGVWWNKSFVTDGNFKHQVPEAIEAAKQYHDIVCMGNMKTFRRFFEASLRKTDHINMYIDVFINYCLTRQGKEEVWNRLHRNETVNETVIKIIMGYTRKRGLFVPEWSDDDKFWL